MAIFRITPTTSVFKDVLEFQHPDAFNRDTAVADTLIVDPGAYLISVPGNGAVLAATGAWTVTVNGSIVSQNSNGILLDAGDTALSTIKIGVDGEVRGVVGIRLNSAANVNNAGVISAGTGIVISNGGAHVITNSGEIIAASGPAIIDLTGISNDTVKNSGTIAHDIVLSGGNDTVTNSGIIYNNVRLGDGSNTLVNSGTINAEVHGGSGADTVTDFAIVGDVMKSGTIAGTIDLGAGNDKFTGGANLETVVDADGADVVKLGGSDDLYIATGNGGGDGIDIVRGGAGIDTYDASAATSDVRIYLDSVNHTGPEVVATSTATGTDIAGANKDTIFGFENAITGVGNDFIYGTGGANVLYGGDGHDVLVGFEGNDTLNGGSENDSLSGGGGKDELTGGSGGDIFGYTALSDSGITAATRDLIADFEPGIDLIHLSSIDANTKTPGTNDAFTFIGTNVPFDGHAGQLHAFWSAIGQIIEGDVNGDKKADFSIEIADPTHAITLTSASFVL